MVTEKILPYLVNNHFQIGTDFCFYKLVKYHLEIQIISKENSYIDLFIVFFYIEKIFKLGIQFIYHIILKKTNESINFYESLFLFLEIGADYYEDNNKIMIKIVQITFLTLEFQLLAHTLFWSTNFWAKIQKYLKKEEIKKENFAIILNKLASKV